ncbi:MAG: DHHA1 domain-containing protein, partial [Actinomycetota bacterium]
QVASLLKVDEERVVERLERLLESVKEMESQISERRSRSQAEEVDRILAEVPAKSVGSARFLMNRRDGTEVGDLRKLAISLGRKLGSSLVVLGSARDSSANLVAAASPDLVSRGVSAQEVLSQGAALLGGRAGGRAELAIAGGAQAAEIDRAMEAVERDALDALGRE